ncbi:MAG: lipopolysaccharide transport periplasmic protein LptA [Arenicella sp.]
MIKRSAKIIFCIALGLLFSNSFALSTDRDQPADISSDEVDIDTNTGRRTFIGNVRFAQGTLRVKGDRIDTTFKDGKLVKAIAYGKPAAFKQRPDGKENDVEGRGQTIIMNQTNNILTLKKRASLKQGFDVVKGNVIIYNMKNDTLKVKSVTPGGVKGSTGKNASETKAAPKTETDPFFKEKTSELKSEAKPAQSSNEKPPVEVQVIPGNTKPLTEEQKPKKLVLPGQSSDAQSGRETNGRSRLIIKPKSKK